MAYKQLKIRLAKCSHKIKLLKYNSFYQDSFTRCDQVHKNLNVYMNGYLSYVSTQGNLYALYSATYWLRCPAYLSRVINCRLIIYLISWHSNAVDGRLRYVLTLSIGIILFICTICFSYYHLHKKWKRISCEYQNVL